MNGIFGNWLASCAGVHALEFHGTSGRVATHFTLFSEKLCRRESSPHFHENRRWRGCLAWLIPSRLQIGRKTRFSSSLSRRLPVFSRGARKRPCCKGLLLLLGGGGSILTWVAPPPPQSKGAGVRSGFPYFHGGGLGLGGVISPPAAPFLWICSATLRCSLLFASSALRGAGGRLVPSLKPRYAVPSLIPAPSKAPQTCRRPRPQAPVQANFRRSKPESPRLETQAGTTARRPQRSNARAEEEEKLVEETYVSQKLMLQEKWSVLKLLLDSTVLEEL